MTGAPVRDPLADHLLMPENTALLQLDWAREDTAPAIAEIVLTDRLLKEQ